MNAPQRHVSRMSLSSVVRGAPPAPWRILVHGTPGVGKTTFAADAPSPIMICPEDGIPSTLDVARMPAPQGGWTWADVVDSVTLLATEKHDYKTVVFDTLDWLEPLVWQHTCDAAGVDSIEAIGGGFGKGYTAALNIWRLFLAQLERLSKARGMHVVALAHSAIRPFKDPQSEGFDRYELKLHKGAAGIWKEWSDATLFAQHEAAVSKDRRTQRVRGVSTGARIMHTVWNAAFDAKNRFGLPEELPLSWDELSNAIGQQPLPPALLSEIKRKASELGGEVGAKALAYLGQADTPVKLQKLNDWCNAKLLAVSEPQQEVQNG